jgi:cellulose synthase/poly-beta-1,6-N-acetylglucosamine synthase-like glycosyltransferase
MIWASHAAVVGGLLAVTILWIFWSVRRHPAVDRGDGLGHVLIVPPKAVSLARPMAFFGVMLIYAVIVVAVRGPVATAYSSVVLRLVLWVLPDPTLVAPYASHFESGLRIMISGSIAALALVIPASPGRRGTVGLHALLYLAMAILLDCLVVVASATTRLPIAYVGIEGIVLNLLLWATVMLRVFFTTMALPRPSQVPVFRRVYRTATIHAVLLGLTVVAMLAIATAMVTRLGPSGHDFYVLLGFMTYSVLWALFLLFLRLFGPFHRPPPLGSASPTIHVIMCAYNESPGIVDSLQSIDEAAVQYAGEVWMTLADDGSADDTVAVSRRAMEAFRAAHGETISCAHGGKSAALNAALARVTSPIAVRIDADVLISPNAFSCLPRWFEDPTVGNVGGVTFPRMLGSWIHKMRLIECIYGYLFVRPALMIIDAVPCIPGTFQAFRPDPVRAAGGMVTGMNGEDADLTLQLGRLGYRAVLDRDIVIHEDVPATLKAYREQRDRWYRSGYHLFARHGPFQGRSAGPRVWLSLVRAAMFRFMMLVRPIVYLYAAVWALEQPSATRNIWFVFVLFGCAMTPMLLCTAIAAAVHGYGRYLPWFLLWFPTYVLLRRFIMIESLLTLPTRPVIVPWAAPAGSRDNALQPDAAA